MDVGLVDATSELVADAALNIDLKVQDGAPEREPAVDAGDVNAMDSLDTGVQDQGLSDALPPTELMLRSPFGDPTQLEVRTQGIYAIWWDPRFDHDGDTELMFRLLNAIREDCLDNLGLEDPPNPAAGYFYNVYIHHGEDDGFPNGWGNGQGTDLYGMPFLTLPDGAHIDEANLYHEGFHIFQYSANAPGFEYRGDSQWYIEATAQWYSASKLPDNMMAFLEAGAITANPHLALWHSFENEAPGDPRDWLFQVRQYGMHTYLFFLTEVAGVDADLITNGFYSGTQLMPQQYHYEAIGGDLLRSHFSDWAAQNTADLAYLTREQVERARLEIEFVADENNLNPFVVTVPNRGTEGWFRPAAALMPRGWGYNVIRINHSGSARYRISVEGDEFGSQGAPAHFEGRIVVTSAAVPRYESIEMLSPLEGHGMIDVVADDADVYIIVAALPEHFTGHQTYGYRVRITRE